MSLAVRRIPLTAALVAGALLAAPSAARAGSYVFGSDLAAPADAVEEHAADTVYWNGALATQRPGPPGEPGDGSAVRRTQAAAPADGQLRYVTIRGGVLPGGGLGKFRFVVLRPAGAAMKIVQVGEREESIATTADPLHRNPYKSIDWDLCFKKGDRLGLWKIGHGNLQAFASIPGSGLARYESATGIGRGASLTGTSTPDRELLMEVLMETGRYAFSHCPGGYEDHIYEGLDVPDSTPRLPARSNTFRVPARCPASTYGGCFGNWVLSARIGGAAQTLAMGPFRLRSGRRITLRATLTPQLAARVRRRDLELRLITKGHDDPTDARNRAAPGRRPGRQSRQTSQKLTLRAAE
jgi:hypothetical protein